MSARLSGNAASVGITENPDDVGDYAALLLAGRELISNQVQMSQAPIAAQIWDMKYRLKDIEKNPVDETVEATWLRIATALALAEKPSSRKRYQKLFYQALEGFRFIPAGRIIAGAGADRDVTLFNCFVMGTLPDNLAGIYEHLKEAAITMQQGGGIGYDFSPIRPKGALVKGVGADASGPISFMDNWDMMCRTIMSAGYRRGAMMATMRCDHPDIEAFIDAKADRSRLRMFNLSVLVTDAFMAAVKADGPWDLVFSGKVYRTIPARGLWDKIMHATYAYAEPGVIFIDRINRRNNLAYCETISSTNPCFAQGAPVMVRREGKVERHEISTLAGRTETIWTGTKWQPAEFRITGTDVPVMKLTFSNGAILRPTPYHEWIRPDGSRVKTCELQKGEPLRFAADIGVPLTVADVRDDGIADKVYCCTVPGEHAFTIFAGDDAIVTGNCGEQPLPPYGACLLGSINLASLVFDPFGPSAKLDLDKLYELATTAVRMMDNVIDVSRFPLQAQEAEAFGKRRIGLGVTGLADALIMCDLEYGSPEAVAATERWMRQLRDAAYRASIELAREKGAFPLLDREAYLAGETIAELPADIRDGIAEYGIRNALITSIAPTGTISLLADNVSSGLEPVFSFKYTRTVLQPDNTKKDEEVTDYAYRLYRKLRGPDAPLTAAFVDAQTLAPIAHVVMQAACQKYIDSSISKTINVPADIAFEAFEQVYLEAYDRGCKGCTTYRPNEVTGSVLKVEEKPESASPVIVIAPPGLGKGVIAALASATPRRRKAKLAGVTHKFHWARTGNIYVTINDDVLVSPSGETKHFPIEVFVTGLAAVDMETASSSSLSLTAALRQAADLYEYGVQAEPDVDFLLTHLKTVQSADGGSFIRIDEAGDEKPTWCPSKTALLAHVLDRHIKNLAITGNTTVMPAAFGEKIDPPAGDAGVQGDGPVGAQCPKCLQHSVVVQNGCATCTSCFESKCG